MSGEGDGEIKAQDKDLEQPTSGDKEPEQVQEQEEQSDDCCCNCCVPEDAKNDKPLEMDQSGEKHPIIDNESRRSFSLCCCLGTDWPALLIFFAFMFGVFILWCIALTKGQVDIALYGMAWNGNICGKGATSDAPYQVWINPTATASLYATAVCMPECPTVNVTNSFATNDTKTIAALETAIGSITDANTRQAAQADVDKLDNRVNDLKQEVTYMSAQLGDTAAELDRSSMYCLCNKVNKEPLFQQFMAAKITVDGTTYDINARCSAQPAASNGYIQLPFSDEFAPFVGDGQNLLADNQIMNKIPCAFRYRTERTFTRCMPWVSTNAVGRITMVMGTSGVSDGVSAGFNAISQRVVYYSNDIYKGGWIITACCAIALVMSISLIFLMSCSCCDDYCRLLAWIVWGTLISVLILLSALTAILAYQYKFYKDRYDTTPELSTYAEDEQAMYIYGVSACIAGVATLMHFCFISPCCCGTEIQNSIEIIISASEVFDRAYALILYPLFHNICVVIAVVCWIIGLIFMSTAGEVTVLESGVHTLDYDENMQRALAFYLFCIIWIIEFMGAVGFMIVAGAILVAFFDYKEDEKEKKWPVYESMKLVLCNHMGTAAIGSFFITLVVIIRWAVAAALEKARQEDTTGYVKYIAACINCCMECIEQCLRYMVNTAYILTVLEGRWFFSAVCGGLSTLLGNAAQVAATNYIAYLVLWLCKLCPPICATALAYLMLESGKVGCDKYDLSSSFNILVPVFLISCVFSFTFIGLLGTSIDVCLIAFLKCESMQAQYPWIMDTIPPAMAATRTRVEDSRDDSARKKGEGEGETLVKDETAKDDSCC